MRVKSQVDTLHRDTVRTNAPADTRSAVAPLAAAAPATLVTPLPGPQKMRAGLNPAYAVAFVALLVLALAAIVLWPRDKRRGSIVSLPQTQTTTTSAATTTTQPPAQQIAEASVTVTSATADSTQLSAPAVVTPITTTTPPPATATVAPPRAATVAPKPREIRPREVRPADPEPEAEPEREAPASGFTTAGTYRDGGDDGANDRALAILRRELRGTTTVALRAGGMTTEVTRALREEFPSLEFASHADVVIRYNGRNERAGAGRRRRAADATIEKNGRIIFRYQLPDEVYRVGQSGAEAFASVLAEALHE
jgi:hypothetical protein